MTRHMTWVSCHTATVCVSLHLWSGVCVLTERERGSEMWWASYLWQSAATVVRLFPQQITVWYEASCLQRTCDSYLAEIGEELQCLCLFLLQCVHYVCVYVCVIIDLWTPTVPDLLGLICYSEAHSRSNMRSHSVRRFLLDCKKIVRSGTNILLILAVRQRLLHKNVSWEKTLNSCWRHTLTQLAAGRWLLIHTEGVSLHSIWKFLFFKVTDDTELRETQTEILKYTKYSAAH